MANFASIADSHAFAEYLNACEGIGCVFTNLGGDATLIAPKKMNKSTAEMYGHVAAFIRRAPQYQIVGMWRLVAQFFVKRLNEKNNPKPVWLSTAGTGIAWLHFRFDLRPKYYQYRPFKTDMRV